MVVEEYINNLKKENDRNTIKGIIKVHDKEKNHLMNAPTLTSNSTYYLLILIGIVMSICCISLGKEISLAVRLIYTLPVLLVSVMALIVFFKVKKNKYSEYIDLQKLIILLVAQIILEFFLGTYLFQYVLFDELVSMDYLKNIGGLLICVTIVIIATIRECPSRFIKEITNTNKKYTYPSTILTVIVIVLITLANIFKPYRLVLVIIYPCILLMVKFLTYFIFKFSKYDLIEQLGNKYK